MLNTLQKLTVSLALQKMQETVTRSSNVWIQLLTRWSSWEWTSWVHCHKRTRQLAHDFPDRPIQETNERHSSHYCNIEERDDRICRQLGYCIGIPTVLLADNRRQFVSKFFRAVTARFGVKHLTTAVIHPQNSRQVESFNRTIFARLRHYVGKHHTDLDQYVQLLTYAYNRQVRSSTGTTAFILVLSPPPPGPATASPASAIPDDITKLRKSFRNRFLCQVPFLRSKMDSKLTTAVTRYQQEFNRIVRHMPQFYTGQHVFVDRLPGN